MCRRDVAPFFGDGPYYEWFKVEEMGDTFGKKVMTTVSNTMYIHNPPAA